MNARTRHLTFIGGIALAAIASLLSCSSSDPTSPDVIGTPGGGVAGNSPSIAFVLPEETCTNAGNTITIYGTDFPANPLPTVTVNGVAGTVLGISQVSVGGVLFDVLTVQTGFDPSTIPPSGLLVDVTVSTANGTTSLPNALRMLPGCTRPPAIVGVDPSSASRTGGTLVTIQGVDLACATSVAFSGTQTAGLILDADIIEVVNDTTIIVESPVNPSLTSETFNVTVTSDCGTGVLPGAFIFSGGDGPNVVPNATAISPPEGPAGGGNEVRITGSDLGLVDSITVGPTTIPSSDFIVQANGEILIPMMPPSPIGASITVPVNVTVFAGGTADTSPVVYTYLGEGSPECGVLSPASGSQIGGTNVIITAALGSTLEAIDGVSFGGVPAATVLHPNPSVLAVITPAYPFAIDVEVELTVSGVAVATCPMNFTYLPSDPSQSFSVDSIFPDQGPQSGGTQIQISGSGLTAVTSIEICDVPATITATADELVTAITGRFDGTTPATCDVVVMAGALGATLPAAFTYTPVVPDGQFFIDGATTAPEAGGMNFRIQGTELIGVTEVSFSGSQGAAGQALACNVQVQSNTEVTGIVPRYFTPGGPFAADVDVFVQSSGGIDPTTAVSLATGRRFRYYANPSLLSAAGPGGNDLVRAGDLVTVTGLNFMPETDVFVGSLRISNSGVLDGRTEGEEELSLPFSVVNNNTLEFFFPAARVQDFYDVTIQTPLPALACTDDYSFTLLRSIFFGTPPAAASVKPPSGPYTGGTEVVISGDFDTEVVQVTIGGVIQPILEQDATSVTVVTQAVPENQAGTALDVVVTGLGGNSTPLIGAYTFIPDPDAVSASTSTVNCAALTNPPTVLPVTQGQVITVTGTDLVGVNSATIGDAEATVFPISDTQIEIAIPPEPGAGGPIFDIVLLATFEASPTGAQDDPLTATLLTAVRYQNPPTVTGIDPATADAGSFIRIEGTNLLNADGTPTQVSFGGIPAATVSANSDGTLLTVQVPAGPEGQAVQVEVTTCQGSAFSPDVFLYPCTRPQVNSLMPASGSGGTIVTIAGLSLLSADGSPTTVMFGDQTALVDLVSSTPASLVVTAPPGTAGDRVEVRLTTCGGEVLAGFFTYGCGTPQITGITPSQGRAGTTVVIQGSNLDSPDGTPVQVIFGPPATGTPAAVDAAASTATQLVVTAPPGVGTVAITVINCGGTETFSITPFTYCPVPSASLAPGDNQGAAGAVITITGTGLLNPDTTRPIVRFGGVEATVLESPVPTAVSLDVLVPAGTGNVIVEVETCGGIARAGSFQYCLPPSLDSFTPTAAPAGALVTFGGSNLVGSDGMPATVFFGAIPATVVDDSPFVVTVPGGNTGTVTVTVTTCGGSSSALFTYCTTPVITDVNVGGGLPEGPAGTAVSIIGTDLVGGDGAEPTVLFGTRPATIIDSAAGALLVEAPTGISIGTTVSVRVVTCGGTGLSMTADNFTYRELPACPTPPSAASITVPVTASGPAGTQVTIEGTELVGADGSPASVLFGAFPAAQVTFAEDVPTVGTDTIVVTAPDGGFADMTTVTVTLVNCGGSTTVPFGYTYLDAGACPGPATPTITSVAPATGGPLTQVTITGTDLFGPDGNIGTVRFGAFTATVITSAEDVPVGSDTIVVSAPDGGFADGTAVDVTVETCIGLSAADTFTYLGSDNCPGPATPTITSVAPATGGPLTQVTITGTDLFGPDGNIGTVRFGAFTATVITSAEDVPAGSDTIVVSAPDGGFADGTAVDVTVETCIGLSAADTFTYLGSDNCPGPATPTITSVAPATGGPLTQVTITGTDLFGPDGNIGTVRFGAFTATVITSAEDVPVGSDTIVVSAPDGGFADGTAVDVTVETCIGLSAADTFTYLGSDNCPGPATPTITSVAPATGGPLTQVTITGTDLFGPDGNIGTVRFGAFTATVITSAEDVPVGSDTIVVSAPDGGFADGTAVDVTVETCIGLSAADTFTYMGSDNCPGPATPTITSVAPATGGPLTQVTITGTDLFGPDGNIGTVRFGAFTATVITSAEDVPAGSDTIVVSAPDGGFADGTAVDVTVETCIGLSAADTFTYMGSDNCPGPATPTITSVAPATGGPLTQVTITGTDLFGPDGNLGTVRFGAFTATVITSAEDVPAGSDTIVVSAPDGGFADGTAVDVTVETCIGLSAADTFTYMGSDNCPGPATPTITSVAPATGGPLTQVTITGTDLFGPDGNLGTVRFGAFTATVITSAEDVPAGSDTIVVSAPDGGFADGTAVDVTVETCIGLSAADTFTYMGSDNCPGPATPTITSVAPATGGPLTQVTITGTDLFGPDGNLGTVRFGAFTATVITSAEDVPAGSDTIVVSAPDGGFADGTAVDVTVETCIGLSAADTFTYMGSDNCPGPATPTITSVAPAMGEALTQVTIVGTDLFGPDGNLGTVRFGAFTATVITSAEDVPAGSDTIVVSAPDGGFADGTAVDVTVETCIGFSAADTFTYVDGGCDPADAPAGSISSPAPAEGAAGTVVTITGTDLVGADGADPVVQFGTRVATLLDVAPGMLLVEAPPGIPVGTTVTVRVTTCSGTADIDPYTYTDAVVSCTLVPSAVSITDPTPAEGQDGTLVTIEGTDLIGEDGNPPTVTFGVFTATLISFSEGAPDTVLVTAPAGPPDGATVEVTVTNCAGSESAGTFDYIGGGATCVTPAIDAGTGVSPDNGQAGAIVTITGTDLVGADDADPVVQFGTRVATVFDATDTQLIVEAPAGIPVGAEVTVRVTTCGGTSNLTETFTYTESGSAFSVSSISPDQGPRTGSTPVTITGTGLTAVMASGSVTICGVTAPVSASTATTVSATTGAYTALVPQTCNVIVTDGTDTDVLVGGYTYQPVVPDATSWSAGPTTAPAAGGGAFELTGTTMLDTNAVSFGGLVNDPTACDLQVQDDTIVTGTIPAYRTPSGPFPATVDVFASSDAGSDLTPLMSAVTYYANPTASGAEGQALMTPGMAGPGELVEVTGMRFMPGAFDHVGAVELEEVSDMGSGIMGFVAFTVTSDTTLEFTMAAGAVSGDVYDITIYTPDGNSSCTGDYGFTLFSGITVP